mmetsp:Transcript_87530/g.145930  ORF Transcript_87530/g.145930 Transcript_87530/m.145930 type:complete len:108 (-) Transcript_87530:72-395(-)
MVSAAPTSQGPIPHACGSSKLAVSLLSNTRNAPSDPNSHLFDGLVHDDVDDCGDHGTKGNLPLSPDVIECGIPTPWHTCTPPVHTYPLRPLCAPAFVGFPHTQKGPS